MPYDKKSFLSGLAAGRNARSWPRQYGDNYFMYTLTAEAGVQVRSPYFVLDGWIHWGDGTVDRVNNDPGDVDVREIYEYRTYRNHVYAESGEYVCIMEGNLRSWAANTHGTIRPASYPALTSVITPFPSSMKGHPDATNMFTSTPNLRSIPEGLLSGISESITSAWGMFCRSGITKVPEKLFWGCNFPLQNGAAEYLFAGSGLTEIPPDLFAYTPNVDYLNQTFIGTPITSIPPALFAPLPHLYSVNYTFMSTNITSIPYNLFAGNPDMINFISLFENCLEVSGEAPPLWEMYPFASGTFCFTGCEGLSNYNSIPRSWGGGRV